MSERPDKKKIPDLRAAMDERDALRAEAGRLREALENCLKVANWNASWREAGQEIAGVVKAVFSSTPLSAAAVERMRLLERAVEAALKYRGLDARRKPGGIQRQGARDALDAALAALDRTESERRKDR